MSNSAASSDVVVPCMLYRRGDKVDAMKKDNSPMGGTWLNAIVLGTNDERNLMAVRYDCLAERKYDEWIDLSIEIHRVAPFQTRDHNGTNRPILGPDDGRHSVKIKLDLPRSPAASSSPYSNPAQEIEVTTIRSPGLHKGRSGVKHTDVVYPATGGRPSAATQKSIPDLTGKGSKKTYFTIAIMLVNTAVFVFEMYKNNWTFESFSNNPLYGPKSCTLIAVGAKDTPLILEGQWWRLVTPMFLHAGVIHLVFNMFSFYRMSSDLERDHGTFVVAIVYLFAGFFSILVSALFRPTTLTVGASGAIFGLLGADWANLIQNWSILEGRGCYLFSLLLTTVLNLAMGMLPLLDNFAHVGGLIGGFFMSLIFIIVPRMNAAGFRKKLKPFQWFLRIASVILLPILTIILILTLRSGADPLKTCPKCSYISCIPNTYFPCTVPTSLNVQC